MSQFGTRAGAPDNAPTTRFACPIQAGLPWQRMGVLFSNHYLSSSGGWCTTIASHRDSLALNAIVATLILAAPQTARHPRSIPTYQFARLATSRRKLKPTIPFLSE